MGVVVSFAEVLATVRFGQPGDLIACVVLIGSGGMQWVFVALLVKLKSNWRGACYCTYEGKMASLKNLFHFGNNDQSWVL